MSTIEALAAALGYLEGKPDGLPELLEPVLPELESPQPPPPAHRLMRAI